MVVVYILAAIGAITTARWLKERWRTRHDKGYASVVTWTFR